MEEFLKQALRRQASSVAVISSSLGERRFAMTLTSVCGLSMDPPSLLACLNRGASICSVVDLGAYFAINFLSSFQVSVAKSCGGNLKGEDRFDVGEWGVDEQTRVPILLGAQANICCTVRQKYDYGSHRVVIGDAVNVRTSADIDPLIYCNGEFATL